MKQISKINFLLRMVQKYCISCHIIAIVLPSYVDSEIEQ